MKFTRFIACFECNEIVSDHVSFKILYGLVCYWFGNELLGLMPKLGKVEFIYSSKNLCKILATQVFGVVKSKQQCLRFGRKCYVVNENSLTHYDMYLKRSFVKS